MTVRPATKADIRTCARIEKQESGESIEIIEDDLEKQIEEEDQFIFVAEEGGKVVGFISAEWQRWNNSVYIDSLYIDTGLKSMATSRIFTGAEKRGTQCSWYCTTSTRVKSLTLNHTSNILFIIIYTN
jgi:hypothetical protein